VPDDVSVVGIDDIPLAGLIHPALTTVQQPIEKLGAAAVELVVKRLSGDRATPARHIVFEPQLVIRASSATPRPAPERRKARPAKQP
jgi:LacI family transcriptional regulator